MNKKTKVTICSIVADTASAFVLGNASAYTIDTMNEIMQTSFSAANLMHIVSYYVGFGTGALLGSTGGYLTGELIFKKDNKYTL